MLGGCVLVVGCSRLTGVDVCGCEASDVYNVFSKTGLFVLVVVSFRPVSASSLNTLRCV